MLYSVLDCDLLVGERLYSLWYSLFFLRLWRASLLANEVYSTEHNFVTLNSYVCIEINAHGLYNMILQHIDNGSFKNFYPWMYGSQPCESEYRLLRSLSSTYSTMVNCDLLDATYRIKKVEQLCHISNTVNKESPINFPRKSQFRASFDRLDSKKYAKGAITFPDDLPIIGETFTTAESKLKAETTMKKILKKAKTDAHRDIKN